MSLAELIGAEAVSALAERFGGIRIYIPKKPSTPRAEELRALIGNDCYQRLQQEYQGLSVWVPNCRRSGPRADYHAIAERNQEIHRQAHLPRRRLARRFGLTESQIHAILRNA